VTSVADVPGLPDASGLAAVDLSHEETLLRRAILGPADMGPAIAAQLADVIEAAVNDPSYVELLAYKGEVPNVVKGEALRERLEGRYDALAEVSPALGLRVRSGAKTSLRAPSSPRSASRPRGLRPATEARAGSVRRFRGWPWPRSGASSRRARCAPARRALIEAPANFAIAVEAAAL
jgi:hypothetical protein